MSIIRIIALMAVIAYGIHLGSAVADTAAMERVLANSGASVEVSAGQTEYNYVITTANTPASIGNSVASVLGLAASQANIDQYSGAFIVVKIVGGNTYQTHVDHSILMATYVAYQSGNQEALTSILSSVLASMGPSYKNTRAPGTPGSNSMPDWTNWQSQGPVGGDWL